MTSHDVVARVRRLAGTRKVGHAGTLDPMATGLLLIGVEGSTRLLHHLVGLDKEYLATIRLGWGTTTDDAEGEALPAASADLVAGLGREAVLARMAELTGTIDQVPSSVSAVKVDGKRAYRRVRDGEAVDLPARTVTVSVFEAGAQRAGDGWLDLDVRVACSSGTYVRALARDLGAGLGVGGHLTALRRTRIGAFDVAEAGGLEGFDVAAARLAPAAAARRVLPAIGVDEDGVRDLRHGKRIAAPPGAGTIAAGDPIAAVGPGDVLVAVVERRGPQLKVVTGFPAEEGA
ncbi:tRNA pseudouridine(55) synthase TruB [Agromyces marinus]|uniref:tRNA pseudouridine(55) synthase TruB n=1 Tax=Agromyces marinus TaxID=1389020 RepID=UPI001F26AE79|nr:tRNA pseudouridine(55) synthase TruB [Agromyces marinus]